MAILFQEEDSLGTGWEWYQTIGSDYSFADRKNLEVGINVIIQNFKINHAKSIATNRTRALHQGTIDLSFTKSVEKDITHFVDEVETLHIDILLHLQMCQFKFITALFLLLFCWSQIKDESMLWIEKDEVMF